MLKSLNKATGAKLPECVHQVVYVCVIDSVRQRPETAVIQVFVCVCVPHPNPKNSQALNNPQSAYINNVFNKTKFSK